MISARQGLLWEGVVTQEGLDALSPPHARAFLDRMIGLPKADWVAHDHGFNCAEEMVRAMEGGQYPNPCPEVPGSGI